MVPPGRRVPGNIAQEFLFLGYSFGGNLISAILALFFSVYFEDIDTIAQKLVEEIS